jgi:hypothetical protein
MNFIETEYKYTLFNIFKRKNYDLLTSKSEVNCPKLQRYSLATTLDGMTFLFPSQLRHKCFIQERTFI